MYSIYDNEINKYLETGRNSPSLQIAMNDLIDLFNEDDLNPAFKDETTANQREMFENMGYIFVRHNSPL